MSIIGAGRLGTALGIALARAGYRVVLLVAKHAASAKRAARLIGGTPAVLSLAQLTTQSIVPPNSILIIATPDDAIADAAQVLASIVRSPLNSKSGGLRVAMHTSGALTSRTLQALKSKGFATASFHPLISISDAQAGADWLGRAFFGIEGDALAVRTARQIVRNLGGQSFIINPERKALYHAAALMASPNLTALFDIVLEMLRRCGLTGPQARRVLLPLVGSTLENFSNQEPSAALTGTFKRGDIATVRKHIAALQAADLNDALRLYAMLGNRSLAIGKPKNRQQIEALLRSLVDPSTPTHR